MSGWSRETLARLLFHAECGDPEGRHSSLLHSVRRTDLAAALDEIARLEQALAETRRELEAAQQSLLQHIFGEDEHKAELCGKLREAKAGNENLERQLAEAADIILDVVMQNCDDSERPAGKLDGRHYLDSMAVSSNAEAMLWLAERGAILLDGEPKGWRVLAYVAPPSQRPASVAALPGEGENDD